MVTKNTNGYCSDDVAMFCSTFYYEFLLVPYQKFDCILYYSTNFASVYLYPLCAVSTLRTSTRAISRSKNYTIKSSCDIIGRTMDFMRIGYLRKNKSSHMNEKIIRLQVVLYKKHFTFYPNSKRVQEGEVRRNQTATVPKDTSRVL